MMCTRAKNSATDSLTPISRVSNSRLVRSYATSSDSSAIFASARHASEGDSMSSTIFSISSSFSSALASACHACSELSTKVRSCNLCSSASGVPDVFTIISESSAEPHLATQSHVRKRCMKVTRLSWPRNYGMVEGRNVPILVDGALSVGAAVAGAVARFPLSTCSLSLANSSSEKFATSLFKESLLGSSIFLLLPQKFLAVEVPGLKVLQDSTLSVFCSLFSSTVRVRDGLDGSRRYSLMMQIIYTQKHNIYRGK